MTLHVYLGEYDIGWQAPFESLRRAERVVAAAKAKGADLVVLPEMCPTGYSMDAARWAEEIDGPSVRELGRIAREASIHLVAGVATRATTGGVERFYNSAILFDRAGDIAAEYRKQRLFEYAKEQDTYTAGDGPVVATVGGTHLGLFICYDLRFPELFRDVAPYVDAIVVIANWPAKRQAHWETLVRARAIESQSYVIAVNRVGKGGELEYSGGSFVYDPWGEPLATSQSPSVEIHPGTVTNVRRRFPFVNDRRGEAVGSIG